MVFKHCTRILVLEILFKSNDCVNVYRLNNRRDKLTYVSRDVSLLTALYQP